jgi:hypothetical protein
MPRRFEPGAGIRCTPNAVQNVFRRNQSQLCDHVGRQRGLTGESGRQDSGHARLIPQERIEGELDGVPVSSPLK